MRYYFLREIPSSADGDFSERRFKELYNSDLANGLGNLIARVAKLAENNNVLIKNDQSDEINSLWNDVQPIVESFRFNEALSLIWGAVTGLDRYINNERPWQKELSDDSKKLSNYVVITNAVNQIISIAQVLKPFLPETAKKILDQFKGPTIKSQPPLFPRLT